MNYKQSKQILEEIEKADKILLNCHRNPDPDSIGSALALRGLLVDMSKQVEVICPSKELFENVNYLSGFDKIKKDVDFSKFDFTKFDLLITLDSSSWDMVSNKRESSIPKIKTIAIDHHITNTNYADINLVDDQTTSVGQLLYMLIEDWGMEVNKDVATCLIAGIVGDTGAFRYPGADENTFRIVSELMKLGADKDMAIQRIYRSEPIELLKFYAKVLSRIQVDKKNRFVWSAIPYEIYSKLDKPSMAKESAASMFAQVIEGTDFGFIALETEPKSLAISLRSRSGFDTSKIALELGGGGHVFASGAKIEGLSFDEAVEKLLSTVRKVVDENIS
ncbi:bifunctional oligoribonuclease/PAP phosphatase NrnA [Candidatus Microgenomates bacterium]|nr:bifunctional oligoribonuclease/PAP phosphatase NrnA [Candidatus Microgenomates bacterium]